LKPVCIFAPQEKEAIYCEGKLGIQAKTEQWYSEGTALVFPYWRHIFSPFASRL